MTCAESDHLRNKRWLYPLLQQLAEAGLDGLTSAAKSIFADDLQWRGSHPINEVEGLESVLESVWRPLMTAFPDLERRDAIFVGGRYRDRDYVASIGHYCGTFRKNWLTIPATGRTAYLRYGEVYEIQGGKVVQVNALWDVLDVIRQAGFWPLAPSLGSEGRWPGPLTADGIVMHETDPTISKASIEQTLAMHKTLGDYNDASGEGRDGLLNMPQKQHWHDKMMWYGPSGIGTTRGLQGFVDYHQLPFRIAFPARKAGGGWGDISGDKKRLGGGHYIRIGDGKYSVTGGWPSVYAFHKGGDFLGVSPTGREVTMRVMDFYLHHEGKIRENWVPLDILNLLLQMDVDVLGRMQSFFNRGALPD